MLHIKRDPLWGPLVACGAMCNGSRATWEQSDGGLPKHPYHCSTHASTALRPACHPPSPGPSRQPQWLIVDGLQGGSGEAFDWHQLRTQAAELTPHSSHGWLLAGGLTPDTVAGEAHFGAVQAAGCLFTMHLCSTGLAQGSTLRPG